MKTLPLHKAHEALKAQFTEKYGTFMPNVYTSVEREYASCREGAGVVDRSCWGVLKVRGGDSLDLLHRLSTNDLLALKPGMGSATIFTNEHGRIVDLVSLLRQEDQLVLVTSPQNGDGVARWIEKFTFSEDAKAENVSDSHGILTVIGPRKRDALNSLFGKNPGELESGRFFEVSLAGSKARVLVAPALELGGVGINLICQAADLAEVWGRLLNADSEVKVGAVGWAAFDLFRIERGIPLPGSELGEEINPLEANLAKAVSFTKGCYVGQEVIARLDTYDKVQKRLCHITLDRFVEWSSDKRPEVLSNGQKVGWMTSLAVSPSTGMPVGLAYVRTKSIQAELEISVRANESEARGRVQGPANPE